MFYETFAKYHYDLEEKKAKKTLLLYSVGMCLLGLGVILLLCFIASP